VVIGNPNEQYGKVVTGTLGPANPHGLDKYENYMLINAEIQQGSSGSPVLDSNGDVIGMIWGANPKSPSIGISVTLPTLQLAQLDTIDLGEVAATPAPAPRASPNIAKWPDGRILTHPEHFVRTCVIKVKSGDTLILRSGTGTRFEPITEIPRDGTDLIAFDQDRVWDVDTWWYPIEWKGFRGYVGRSFLGATD
jgi:hypothetical protein